MFKKIIIVLSIIIIPLLGSFTFAADPGSGSDSGSGSGSGSSTSSDSIAGVDDTIKKLFEASAEALEIQATAYAREVSRRPESVLDLSCFPKSMNNYASLGKLFSDLEYQFNFKFSGNPLCELVSLDLGSSLKGDLGALFKVPGFTLPDTELCGPKLDLKGDLSTKITGFLGVSVSTADVEQCGSGGKPKKSIGCPIDANLKISGNFKLESPCIDIKLPDMSCQGMTSLFSTAITEAVTNITGVDLSKDGDKGWVYLTLDDQGKIETGVDIELQDVLDATGIEALQDVQKKLDDVEDVLNTISSFTSGFNASASLSLGGNYSTEGSSDGLTSDGGISKEMGSSVRKGTGEEFVYQFTQKNNKKPMEDFKEVNTKVNNGPGKDIASWKASPSFSSEVYLMQVINTASENDSKESGSK